ncbi:MAG: ABC transporter substrate binding protein [Desulfobacteraceae bacterium]
MKPLLLIVILAAAGIAYGSAEASQGEKTKKINMLYLNSYEAGYQWSDTILDGIKSVVHKSGLHIDLYIEYMDTKIRYNHEVEKYLFAIYAHKYRNVHFDVIIVSDNNGFDFYRNFHNDLFPGVPTIFCGVNDFNPQSIKEMSQITGVVESFDIKENLELAQKFHPQRKRFVVIENNSTTSKLIKSQILKAFKKMAVTPKYEFLEAISLDQLTRDAKAMADDSVFYIIPFYMDDPKGRYTATEIVSAVWESTGAPLYSNWKFMAGSGVVGGKMIDGFQHGVAAARMAISVLEGKSPMEIPIVKPNDELFIFDNKIMDKFGIKSEDLPSGSTIINRTAYFFEVDRQVFWLLVVGAVMVTVTLVFLIFNISQRKAAEGKLKDQLTFVRQLMNTIPIPIYFRNKSGRFTGVNLSLETWFSMDRNRIIGASASELENTGPGQLVDDIDTDLLIQTGIKSYEKRINLGSQGSRDVILHKASYTNTKNEVVGIVGAIHDITNRKLTEEELRESQQMLQLVLDNIPQHVHWKDKDLRYIGVNRSFGNFHGLKNLDVVADKTDMDLMKDKEVARLSMKTDRAVVEQDKGAYHLRWTIQRNEKDKVWLRVNRVPLHDNAGKVVGVLSTAEDITENVMLQHKLVETTKMEAIGTLAGGIAHDFNNILTSIINSTELAIEDIPSDTMAAKDLLRSLKAARRGSRLVKQILTFSRADTGGFKPIQISEVVEEAIHLIEASLPRNIQIKPHIATELSICEADPTQIHQVVMNLCTNAFQSLKQSGGELCIHLCQVEIDEKEAVVLDVPPGPYIQLVVTDNGHGIDPEIQDKIFDPFFTTKQQGEGTGLGLAVVRGIVKAHNGAIRVESTPHQETKFEIYLPLPATIINALPKEDLKTYNGTETILFVEDDEDQLELIPRVLSQLGYKVLACPDGKAACRHIADKNHGFDLIITDYDMPEMTGLQLAGEAARHLPDIPVIVVTGRKPPEEMKTSCFNIKKLLRKPYNKDSISKAIREVLDHEELPIAYFPEKKESFGS